MEVSFVTNDLPGGRESVRSRARTVALADDTRISSLVPASLDGVRDGSYIGTATKDLDLRSGEGRARQGEQAEERDGGELRHE
jgi:hypothetical protein